MSIKSIAKSVLYPLVLVIRAYRAYKIGMSFYNWHKFVVSGELVVRMTEPNGEFHIDARSHLLSSAFLGRYEPEIMNTLSGLSLTDGNIVNIGANIGFYSAHFANIFPDKRIYAIEPNPEAFILLQKNIERNSYEKRILPLNICISNTSGKVSFTIIPGKSEFSSIGGINFDGVKNDNRINIEVDSKLLNEAIPDETISLIFMDVEGAEKLVLDGCIELIKKYKPIIIAECADMFLKKFNSSSKELIKLISDNNYNVFDIRNRKTKIKYPFNGNIIAIPNKS